MIPRDLDGLTVAAFFAHLPWQGMSSTPVPNSLTTDEEGFETIPLQLTSAPHWSELTVGRFFSTDVWTKQTFSNAMPQRATRLNDLVDVDTASVGLFFSQIPWQGVVASLRSEQELNAGMSANTVLSDSSESVSLEFSDYVNGADAAALAGDLPDSLVDKAEEITLSDLSDLF